MMALSLLVHWGPAKASGSQTLGISAQIPVPEESHPLEEAVQFAASSSKPGRKGEVPLAPGASLPQGLGARLRHLRKYRSQH